MKKIALFIILFLLFLPVNVFGEDVGLNVYDEDDNVKYGVRFRIRYNEKNYVCITYYYSASGGFVTDCYDADVSERISISSVDSSFYFALNDEQIVEGPFYIKVIPKNGTNDIYGINITNLQYYLNQYPGATETNGYAKYPIFEIPDPSCLEIEGWNGLDDDEKKEIRKCFFLDSVNKLYLYKIGEDDKKEFPIYDSYEGSDDGDNEDENLNDIKYDRKQQDLTIGGYTVKVGINEKCEVGYISKSAYGKNVEVESDAIPDRYIHPGNYIYYNYQDDLSYIYTEKIIHKKAICYSYDLTDTYIKITFEACTPEVSCGAYHFYKKTDIFEKISNSNFSDTDYSWNKEEGYYQLEVDIGEDTHRVVKLGDYCPMAIRVNGVENNLIKENSTLDLISQGSALADLDSGYYLVHDGLIGEQGKPNDKYSGVEDCGDLDVNRIKACGCIPAGIADITSRIYFILRIVGPLLLLILGGFEMAKAISTQDESAISKAKKKLVNKFIAAAAIFLTLTVIKFIVGIVADNSKALFECIEILLNGYVI